MSRFTAIHLPSDPEDVVDSWIDIRQDDHRGYSHDDKTFRKSASPDPETMDSHLYNVFATKHKHSFLAQPRGQPPNHIVRGPSNLIPCLRSIHDLSHILS